MTAEFVIGGYHRLYQIEKGFWMTKSDVQAKPIYHCNRDSNESDLTIVFAAPVVSRWIEHRTGWSIRKFVKNARRYRMIHIQAGHHIIIIIITAADPIPSELRQVLDAINHASRPAPYIEATRVRGVVYFADVTARPFGSGLAGMALVPQRH